MSLLIFWLMGGHAVWLIAGITNRILTIMYFTGLLNIATQNHTTVMPYLTMYI